ncbi:MAG: PAS domain S-box protein [Thermodesulfobacteriota bacterium]
MVRDPKQSPKASKETEAKYRTIFENSKDMVFITALDGRFIEVNQAGVELLGYSDKNELLKRKMSDTCLNPKRGEIFQKEVAEEGFIKDFEAELRKKDGETIDCLITATLRKDEEGHSIGYEGIIKNISERKKMEEELFQRAEELQTLYELSILINQSLNIEDVLPLALDKASTLTGFESGGVYLFNENKGILELKFHKGCSAAFIDRVKVLPYGAGICGRAIQLKKPIYFSIDEYPFSELLPLHKEEGTQSLMGIPLLAKEKVIGAITLSSHFTHEFTQRRINLLLSIGNQVGLALENARLFSDVAEARSEWETTFNAVTDLISIRDKNYRILRANQAAFKRFGLKREEMIGKRCYEVLHRRSEPCAKCHLSKTLMTKKPAFGERKSGYLNGVVQYHTFPIFDEAGEIVAVVDLSREITEQKRMEREREVVNSINEILASSLDVRQVMQAVHSELKKVLDTERMTITLLLEKGEWYRFFSLKEDFEAKEMIGRVTYPIEGTPLTQVLETGLPVMIADSAAFDSWFYRRLFGEGIRSSIVFPLEYKEKIIGTMNLSSKEPNHFSKTQFNFLYQISSGLSISIENSLLLDEIKASEERYRIVVENAVDGVLVVGEDYRFKYVNQKLTEILAYSREELTGMDFRELLDDESRKLIANRYDQWKKGIKLSPIFEINLFRKDGELRNIEISAREIKGTGGFVAFLRDINEKKKMEEQFVENEKLRALGEMASGVAHDFNNALAAILGNAQLLLYTAKDKGLIESLKTIEKVAQRGAQSVRMLQDFTRRRVQKQFFKIDVNAIVKDAIEMTKPKWKDEVQSKGTDIEIITHLEDVSLVLGDAFEMREVITSLVFNAIDAMPEGGKIEFRTYQVANHVYIQISDTGIGMTEEVKKKIFEPFFTTKPFSNTGLGLSMSYGIIKRFGGEIKVVSEVGYGTTFTIILPIGSEAKEKAAVSPGGQRAKETRILVVDDEETVRDVLSKMLSLNHYRVTTAENGEEAIRLFKESDFSIVLTDLGMPGMPGWEVCKAIKKISPQTPVGMITGWGVEVDQAKIRENGIDFLIPKPFQFDQILKVLTKTMTSKS